MNAERKRNSLDIWYLILLVCITCYGFSFDLGLSIETTRFILLVPFAGLAVIISDWYYFRLSDTYKGIALLIFFGVIVSIGSLVIQINISGVTADKLLMFMSDEWAGARKWNLKFTFQLGIAAVFVGLVGVPRLLMQEFFESETNE